MCVLKRCTAWILVADFGFKLNFMNEKIRKMG